MVPAGGAWDEEEADDVEAGLARLLLAAELSQYEAGLRTERTEEVRRLLLRPTPLAGAALHFVNAVAIVLLLSRLDLLARKRLIMFEK